MTKLSVDFIDEFYETTDEFYRYAFLKAAKNVTREDADYFFSILKKMEDSASRKDFEFYIKGVSILMQKVLQIAQNRIFEDIINDLIPSIERVQFTAIQIMPSFIQESLNLLRESYEYLSNNTPEKAIESYWNFSKLSKKVLLDHFKSKVTINREWILDKKIL